MDQPAPAAEYDVGYKKPPKKTQFAKGQSGNPRGRPKRPETVSLRELFSGEQRGKNGEVISRREALLIKLLNDAMAGKPRAFARFVRLMVTTGLFAKDAEPQGGRVVWFPRDKTQSPYTINPHTREKEPFDCGNR
jgi:Family of unknown function (DUF5681)